MRLVRPFLFCLSLVMGGNLTAAQVVAPSALPFKTQKGEPKRPSLIDESNQLRVLQETSVQQEEVRARMTYGLSYANLTATKLEVISEGQRLITYSDTERPALLGNLGYFPFRYRGFLGVVGNVAYSYGENRRAGDVGDIRTALHWIASDLSITYRYEVSTQAWLKPFVGLGGGYNVLVQRGPSYYNTSEARGFAIGTLGLSFNLNRLFKVTTPLLWELTTQYRRVWDNEDDRLDFNGEHLALGLELAL